ncbi:MAG TPA: type II toxin-antitoxin system RelE/ParE family toxin [Gaiellaceae bacterium]|nr:type II toxin-antitoxin system RelE/ParE family toxin [Gaiellaceae bacterium]
MARVIVTPEAIAALERLIVSHSLPADTRGRFRRSLEPLETFPRLGRELRGGGYDGLRFVLGPWRWLVVVYAFDEARDIVGILTVQDARSSAAATLFRA